MKKFINNNDTMAQFLQKQPQSLTMARHNLGIHQMRIMVRIVEQLQPHLPKFDKELNKYEKVDFRSHREDLSLKIKVSELALSGNYKPLRSAIDGLMKKIVRMFHYVESKDMASFQTIEIGMPMIKEYEYKHGSEYVEIGISGKLLPQFIDLARGYTRYSLDVAFNTSSPNVLKLYQFISQFRDKKQVQCNVDTLRKWLQLEKKYKMPGFIKSDVLKPAMVELKEKADVWFEIAERVTRGRNMIGWKFNIFTKKRSKPKSLIEEKQTPKPEDTELEAKLTDKYKLGKTQAKKLSKWVGKNTDRHKQLSKELYEIQLLIINHKLQNVGGYTAKVLAEKLGVKL